MWKWELYLLKLISHLIATGKELKNCSDLYVCSIRGTFLIPETMIITLFMITENFFSIFQEMM